MNIRAFLSSLIKPIRRKIKCGKAIRRACAEFSASSYQDLVMYDVGARWGVSKPYDQLADLPGFFTVGFEPDVEEALRLEKSGVFGKAVPVGLSDREEERVLNIARDPGSSSVFKPNMVEIARHTGSTQFETVREVSVSLTTLENACKQYKLPLPDFIKVDCEGAEGIIFAGAGPVLDHVIGVSFEARVFEFYKGEPRLQKLLDFFFDRGFVLLDLDPVGYFHGEKVMFDVAMIRHPEQFKTDRDFAVGELFALIFENMLYSEKIKDYRSRRRS